MPLYSIPKYNVSYFSQNENENNLVASLADGPAWLGSSYKNGGGVYTTTGDYK